MSRWNLLEYHFAFTSCDNATARRGSQLEYPHANDWLGGGVAAEAAQKDKTIHPTLIRDRMTLLSASFVQLQLHPNPRSLFLPTTSTLTRVSHLAAACRNYTTLNKATKRRPTSSTDRPPLRQAPLRQPAFVSLQPRGRGRCLPFLLQAFLRKPSSCPNTRLPARAPA